MNLTCSRDAHECTLFARKLYNYFEVEEESYASYTATLHASNVKYMTS